MQDTFHDDRASHVILTESPPRSIPGVLRRLGPGLIIAGSIVGSGELIATTATGAEARFWLLWLIIIGCVIKVFCQVELGRYTLVSGKTTLAALSDVPGPRLWGRANWLTTYWLIMFLVSLGQLGGIVGGVGQALQISCPVTENGRLANRQSQNETQYAVLLAEERFAGELSGGTPSTRERQPRLDELGSWIIDERRAVAEEQMQLATGTARQAVAEQSRQLFEGRVERFGKRPEKVFDLQDPELKELTGDRHLRASFQKWGKRSSSDDRIWAAIITVVTAILLFVGRYGFVQSFSTILVAGFTFVTVLNVCMLQLHATWSVRWADIVDGLSFRLPPNSDGTISFEAVATALATFGIIGVGANELIQYPYWCVEKGYARFTGPRDDSDAWATRALGWMRVMRWDAWCSMVIYTFATIAFYLLGAAILGRSGLNPEGQDMIQTLSVMYEPVFGLAAKWVFLFGAFAVLYSTFFVATAGHSRVFPEGLQMFGLGPSTPAGYQRCVRVLSCVFPFLCLSIYLLFPSQPKTLILLSGSMQGIMLPMLAAAAIYFRYRRGDTRLAPGIVWDICLWVSACGMLVTASWSVWGLVGGLLG